jgi:hypothetical protein
MTHVNVRLTRSRVQDGHRTYLLRSTVGLPEIEAEAVDRKADGQPTAELLGFGGTT